MREIQIEAKNVQAAIENGLQQLGLRRDQVEVVVKSEGTNGFFGIGAKKACIVLREKKWGSRDSNNDRGDRRSHHSREGREGRGGRGGRGGRNSGGRDNRGENNRRGGGKNSGNRQRRPQHQKEFTNYEKPVFVPMDVHPQDEAEETRNEELNIVQEPTEIFIKPVDRQAVPENAIPAAEEAKTLLSQLLEKIGIAPKDIKTSWDPVQGRVIIEFDCDSPQILIGKDGKTLESLQYVLTLMISRKHNLEFAVQIETGEYWSKIEKRLYASINRAIGIVKRTGRPYRMEPMSPVFRRFVHRILTDNPEVETMSEGEGKWRKVVIRPKQAEKTAA